MKKILTVFLAAAMAAICAFAGACDKHTVDNTVEDTKNLYIYVETKGYGNEMIYALAEAFEAKNSGVIVHVKDTTLNSVITNTMDLGPEANDYDLYFSLNESFTLRENYKNVFVGYEEGVYEMTDLYNTVIPGEELTLGEKMLDTFRDYYNLGTEEDPHYFGLSWVTGTMGMTYNAAVFREVFGDNFEEKLPRTTDELFEVASALKAAKKVPFVFPAQIDYFQTSMLYPWWAQYEGLESYYRFFDGLAWDPVSETYILSKEIYSQQGRLEALEAMNELVCAENGFVLETAMDYNANNFRTLQTRFLTAEQGYAMYPCGDWLEQESSYTGSAEIGMMQTPVISSIVDRLSSITGDEEQKEKTLRDVIDYVDGKTDVKPAGVSDEDIEEVRQARNMFTSTHGFGHTAWMPAYCNAKALAEKFLLFMASDEGIEIFKANCGGGFLPFKHDYDQENLSYFEKTMEEKMDDIIYVGNFMKNDLFVKGGITAWGTSEASIDTYFTSDPSSRYHAEPQAVFDMMKKTESQWQNALFMAGLI